MKKKVEDFRTRALKNLDKIRGGGADSPIDRDKVRTPKFGKR